MAVTAAVVSWNTRELLERCLRSLEPEPQWLFAEDLELGWRLRDRGWVTWSEPPARVLHDSGAATRPAFGAERSTRFMTETYALIARRCGRAGALATALVNVLGAVVRLDRRWLHAHLNGARDAIRSPR